MNRYTGILHYDEESGWWAARCVEVPAAITQGHTRADALRNLKSAIHDVIEYERLEAANEVSPADDVVEVAVAS